MADSVTTAGAVYVLDALAVAGSAFVLVWSTVPGSRDSALGVLVIALTALLLVGLTVALARLGSRPLPAIPAPLLWLPLLGAALVTSWHLLAGRELGPAETAVALGLALLVMLRQSFTGLDNVRLVRELQESQDRLRAQAYHDSLTGLANRALFDQRLRRAIRGGRPLGLIFCDLDDFKAVNDRLGHNAGDEVLRAVAGRLRACVRPMDTVARLGGDEFAILMEDAAESPDVIGNRILGAVGKPFQLEHRGRATRVLVGASVGVAVLDKVDQDASPESLLARVDQAMYAAKRRGKNQLVTFRHGTPDSPDPRYLPLPDPEAPPPNSVPALAPNPVLAPATGPIPRNGTSSTMHPVTPAAQYRASGQARPEPPRPPATEEELKAQERARLTAAAQRSVERSLAEYQALEKESERREAERAAAERRAAEALQIEAEVRAGTRPEAEVIPLSRAVDLRAQKQAAEAEAAAETLQIEAAEAEAVEAEAVEATRRAKNAAESQAAAAPSTQPRNAGPVSEAETLQRAEQLAALSSDHISVLYRPVLSLRTGQLTALAAAVRWQHPVHGPMPVDALMSAAEQAGLRRPLEERLLDSICSALALLRKAPDWDELTAHVPLPTLYLADDRLVTVLERTLRRHDLPGSALVLQITEDGPSPDLNAAARVLGRVRALGVSLGLEAFGAGPGDLGFLTRLPIDNLTLHRSLAAAEPGSRSEAVLAGTIAMTPGLKLTLIADGVSHQVQADRLHTLGVDLAQGPLYGEPVPLPELDLLHL
ncbi:bifunctional diguanylate cyclase/phosphodiesterase [Kineosporia babensis]|uniref:Bifunctional diguanylate cyclase/phosphodiesterase n=1 Tax=Kineosporia babensis TaxID=499548 RepID=A0A9X1T015_9ACTN|nr:bifunctional diguanylate cyclase/phosphodiesterase [Kineosporia babensis]MCD5312328.1 bifunctional diguanylate cyclase/phosphodiesterase [Kineosporia babensis]